MKSLREYGTSSVVVQDRPCRVVYSVVIEEIPLVNGGCSVENYGVHVAEENGRQEEITGVSFSLRQIMGICGALQRTGVMPDGLRDAVSALTGV